VSTSDLHRHAERLLAAHGLPEGDAGAVASLLGRCQQRRAATGDVLFREGERGKEMVFLLEGRATVLKRDHTGREREIGGWFPPAVIGALALIDDSERSATCVIGAPSLLAALDADTVRQLLGEASAEGAHLRWILLSAFAETLANTTVHLRQALSETKVGPPDLDRLHALLERART
jgi:CRP-like cAMP-binding protein